MGVLFITRHGETDFNRESRVTGSTNIDLNEKGIEQAVKASENLNFKFDFIISSPLKRAIQTAEIFSRKYDKPIIIEDRIREIFMGLFEGMKKDFIYENHSDLWAKHKNDFDCHEHNGESINDTVKRVYEFLDEIKIKYPNKSIFLVAHAFVTRVITSYFTCGNWDRSFEKVRLGNCEINKFEF
ncbi:MAG: histidine phosphatase family protein [Candidatus Delongbacteria bacterium]|nr:histidine phosphatase family protein [Candidatus Delongbacteria bacterium]MBN2835008.1 histidine phosphatase family protein [Candidatus Delongbacteria bacterium]